MERKGKEKKRKRKRRRKKISRKGKKKKGKKKKRKTNDYVLGLIRAAIFYIYSNVGVSLKMMII